MDLTSQLAELKMTSRLLAAEAMARGWGVSVMNARLGLVEYRIPGHQRPLIFHSTIGPFSKATDVYGARDKQFVSDVAQSLGMAVPDSLMYSSDEAALSFLSEYGRIVVKPLDGAHGQGVSLDITDEPQLQRALDRARTKSESILLQEQVNGKDVRALCIGGKFVAAAERTAARVTGNGVSTIAELIKSENTFGLRGVDYQSVLNIIDSAAAELYLGERLNEVPAANETVQVVAMVNIGMGGTSTNVTDFVPKILIEQAELIADYFEMAVCGVDFLLTDGGNPRFIELNANPSFTLHVLPNAGDPVPVHKLYLDWVAQKLDQTL